jgi:trimethylamine--corrinoid protein Co-methyltransferase
MVLAGISGPINVAGTAVMEITESLAGIVLAQLVNPGTPCVCGGTSCAADMRTGGVNLGGPEFLQLMAISTQMADYYGIPCRYGGGLTDSYSVNIQAGIESSLAIAASLFSGIHFMHQACGILGAYSAISFEKFVIDEAVCAMTKRAVQPLDISDKGLGLEVIERVGSGGNFLMQPETARQCRTAFFSSPLFVRGTYSAWESNNLGDVLERAEKHVEERIASYVKPDIDPSVVRDLKAYVTLEVAI